MSETVDPPWDVGANGPSNPNGLQTYMDQLSELRHLDLSRPPAQPASAEGAIWPASNPVGTERAPLPPEPSFQWNVTPEGRLGATSDDNPLTAGTPSPGQAITRTASDVGDWAQRQRDEAERQGLWDPVTNRPTAKGVQMAGRSYAEALVAGTSAPGEGGVNPLTAYHGTPHKFAPTEDNPLGAFDLSKIGSGEGAQVYGHGAYLAGNESIARHYRDALSPPQEPTLDFSATGGPSGLTLDQSKDAARDFMMEHPNLEFAKDASVTRGADHAVDRFFKGENLDQALDMLPDSVRRDYDTRKAVTETYNWLGDAKLDPGGAKVGDEPWNEKNDVHKAAWYVDQAGGDRARAVDDLDTELFNMQGMRQAQQNAFGKINPAIYDEPMARVQRLKSIIQEQGADLPKYTDPDRGHMYQADINVDPEHMLHWDKPLSQQSDYVRQRLSDLGYALPEHDVAHTLEWRPGGHPDDSVLYRSDDPQRRLAHIVSASNNAHHVYDANGNYLGGSMTLDVAKRIAEERLQPPPPVKEPTGEEIYQDLARRAGKIPNEPGGWGSVPGGTVQQYGTDPAKASEMLRDQGIPALRFYDANSRRQGLTLPDRIRDAQGEVNAYAGSLKDAESRRGSLAEGSPEWVRNELHIINTQNDLANANRRLSQHRASANDLSHNYVVFDPATVNIIKRYGIAGLLGGGAAAGAAEQ